MYVITRNLNADNPYKPDLYYIEDNTAYAAFIDEQGQLTYDDSYAYTCVGDTIYDDDRALDICVKVMSFDQGRPVG